MSGLAGFSFASPDELADAAARDCIHELLKRNLAHPFGIALSGGRISRNLFTALVAQSRAASLNWSNVHFFWTDERSVPPDDPESNYRTASLELFEPLAIPAAQIHRVRGEVDPETAAQQAEAEIASLLPRDANEQPILDLLFLGIGEDGHVASLFPGESDEAIDSPRVYRAVVGPKPPPQRVTLGYPAIAAARQVWILASGQGKEPVYKALMQREVGLPAVRVVTSRRYTRLYEDISRKKL